MPASTLAQPVMHLIHDSDRNAYDAAVSEGWHVSAERTRRAHSPRDTEPHSEILRGRYAGVRAALRQCA